MLNIPCSNNKKSSRYAFIDYLRGIALLLMFAYHFSFDLNYFQFIDTNFNTNPWWINFRIVIVSLFLWLVGISLWLATHKGINRGRYLKRLIALAIASIIVSYSSYITFPKSYIFFGILQFILVASVVGLIFIRFHYINLILGLTFILLGVSFSHPLFNHSALQWLGLMTYKPITEDYVPFLPWFGVVLIGIFSASTLFTIKAENHSKKTTIQSLSNKIIKWQDSNSQIAPHISCMGRYSLIVYLIHQPIFMGILYIFSLMFS